MSWTVFQQQPTQPAEPRLHLALFPKYWLSREKLETWLGKKFPEHVSMFDIEIRNDKWAFYIPRPLTREDQGELINERDEPPPNASLRRSQSVEP
ncbi:hypothetical protein GJ744_001241 [Endocarpon pusillum]|uniref:Uncharacterized protein n=1 Tax=Endocarpon pusillum TaxID=364733 RepID=A0A8H7ADI4_9EURO|nr:hypothetical protein GJ744_001241 [Endocarpon pusillum]